jgi:hypothetical protein
MALAWLPKAKFGKVLRSQDVKALISIKEPYANTTYGTIETGGIPRCDDLALPPWPKPSQQSCSYSHVAWASRIAPKTVCHKSERRVPTPKRLGTGKARPRWILPFKLSFFVGVAQSPGSAALRAALSCPLHLKRVAEFSATCLRGRLAQYR